MQKLKQFVRDNDVFAIPVRMSYKGNRQFNTILGGICTILFGLAVGSVFLINLHAHLNSPVYDLNTNAAYLSYNDNHQFYNMSTQN